MIESTSARAKPLRRALRNVGFLRSTYYLALELKNAWSEPEACLRNVVDEELARSLDPWGYETDPRERARFARQASMIDAVRNGRLFRRGLEIGCAQGHFTEAIAERCESLQVLDISPTALARARNRCAWPASVGFHDFDVRRDPIPGKFDLIVVAGVLEYFPRRTTLGRVREKLAEALEPGGCLLIESTRGNRTAEGSWWSRHLVRGKWINHFISCDPRLRVETGHVDDLFAITMLRRQA